MRLIFALLLLIVFNGCNRKPKYYNISPLLKSYVDFAPGTYWIFKDSSSNSVDSMSVVYRNISYDYDEVDNSYKQRLGVEALYISTATSEVFRWRYDCSISFLYKPYSKLLIKPDSIALPVAITYDPFYTDPLIAIDSSGTGAEKRLAYENGSFTTGNNTYNDVVMFVYPRLNNDTLYTSINLGLFAARQKINGVIRNLSLIRCKIVRP